MLTRAILALLLSPICVWAGAPTVVQSKNNFGSNVTTVTATLTSNVTAGNMLIACAGTVSTLNSVTINTPTMTGETFTAVTGAANTGAINSGQVACFAVNSVAGGHNAVVSTITATSDLHLHVFEVNGQIGSPRDATGNTNSTTMSVTTSATTTTANDLVLAFFYDHNNNRTLSAGAGYVSVEQSNNVSNGDVGYSEKKTVSATGTQTATASGNSTDNVAQAILAIAGTASGATCSTRITLTGAGCQ